MRISSKHSCSSWPGQPCLKIQGRFFPENKRALSSTFCTRQIGDMRHKMHFLWIFCLSVMVAGVTPAEGTLDSWGLSSLRSLLDHPGIGHPADAALERSLSRHKRAVAPVSEFIVDIEISFPDPSMASLLKEFLTTNLTLPWTVEGSDTNITSIAVTTACNQTGSDVQCSCESGYFWPSETCPSVYSPCPGTSNSSCTCIKSTTFPSQYCQLPPVNINLSLKLLDEFTDDFHNTTSEKYKKYKSELESQFNTNYKTLPGFRSATIYGFRPGSIIADYTVVTEPTTTQALTTANTNLIVDLNTNTAYKADSIRTEVVGWANVTMSPSYIFAGDTVTLTCTVNVTISTSDVSWYYNRVNKLQNNSTFTISTTLTSGRITSVLTISRASSSNSGDYKCSIDTDTSSYVAQATVNVLPMELTKVDSSVTCNNTKYTIAECCTRGATPEFQLICQRDFGSSIPIKQESSSTCQLYTITASSQDCTPGATSSFSCNCSTDHGAALYITNVAVLYSVVPSDIVITTTSDQVSEWSPLTLVCTCATKNVQSMSWNFIDSSMNNAINVTYYTNDLANCNSTLTIPAQDLSYSWKGTFQCVVNNGFLSANKTISVYRLPKTSQIKTDPITKGFKCDTAVPFLCCLDAYYDDYKPDGTTLKINLGSNTIQRVMELNRTISCFTTSYTPSSSDGSCKTFSATCTITNVLGQTVESSQMMLQYVADPKCSDAISGYGAIGDLAKVPCERINSNQTGEITYTCTSKSDGTAYWRTTDTTCTSKLLNTLNDQVDGLISPGSEVKVPGVLYNLSSAVIGDQSNIVTSVASIQLIVNILQKVEGIVNKVEQSTMSDFLSTVSVVVDNSTTTTWNGLAKNESSNLLQAVENFAGKLSFNGSVNITNKNVQLIGYDVRNLASGYKAGFSFEQVNGLTGNVTIDKKALRSTGTVVSLAYPTLKDILGAPQNSTNNETVGGLVMTTILANKSSDFSISMDFKKSNASYNKARCVFWNFTTRDWDDTGCKALNSAGENVACVCDHLTSFSILMSTSEENEGDIVLEYITYIGVGISMFSLVVCIIIEAMVWKSVTKNKTSYLRHVCIMNIAVTLLMADIWFIIGAAMNTTDKVQACVAATFFAHLFYLCVFFWMLTMGLILFYRLMCVFHDLSKTVMMGISFFLGYGCPIIITVITVGVTQPSNTYLTSSACWLNIQQSKAFLAFILPALTILLVNFITLLVVILKVLRPSVGDKPKKEEKSSLNHIAKCILILTPLLGLTWGFGIGTMASSSIVIKGIFAALNSLQGLFILLFGCLMDKKVRDALFSRFSISRWSSQQTKTSNLSSSTETQMAKKGISGIGSINLFAKKGVYHISSVQMSTSSEMSSSNSYSLLT